MSDAFISSSKINHCSVPRYRSPHHVLSQVQRSVFIQIFGLEACARHFTATPGRSGFCDITT